MPMPRNSGSPASIAAANVGYEAERWPPAAVPSGSMDADAHVVLGFIFLK